MIDNWQDLEEYVCNLLRDDKATTTPGSGNSKKEEDVVGISTLAQCKYSSKRNINIQKTDFDRLNLAATLQHKTPLFFNYNQCGTTLTIKLDKYPKAYITYIILLSMCDTFIYDVDTINDKYEFSKLEQINNRIIKIKEKLINHINYKMRLCSDKLEQKQNDLLQCNLFEKKA